MHCVVTAGPTYETMDNVRRLTNFSTGRLGTELANFLTARGHQVTLLLGEQATYCGERKAQRVEPFSTTADLAEKLKTLATQNVDAVFHAAAVSDFAFGKIWLRSPAGELSEIKSGKISTRQGTLMAELVPTPKIIASLRHWYPQAILVGWKFEVDGDRASVLRVAEEQLKTCRTDACVANGKAYGDGFGLVTRRGKCQHIEDMRALFHELVRLPDVHSLESVLAPKNHLFRITFTNDEAIVLSNCMPTDTYLEDTSPRWTGVVVSFENVPEKRRYIFEPGNGLDFNEGNVAQIFDVTLQKVVFERGW